MNDLKHYMSLPYRIELIPDEGGIVARVPDLPGCMSSGDTPAEALAGLEEAKELWISARLNEGHSVPEPKTEEDTYSGKFVLRIPKSLHRSLDERACAENMSLNSYVLFLLTERHTKASAGHAGEYFLGDAVLWDEAQEYAQAFKLGAMCRKTVIHHVGGFDIGESLPHINAIPRPPREAHIPLGTTKDLKDFKGFKKKFSTQ